MINVFHIVSNKTWGGAERYASDLVAHMRHDPNFYVEVVSAKNDDIIEQFQKMDIPVSILPLKGIRDIDSPVRLARMLKKGKNIVHVHSYRDAVTAVMARIISDNPNTKVVFTPHGLKKPNLNYVSKKIYRSIDQFVFVSQFAYDYFASHAPRIKSFIIENKLVANVKLLGFQRNVHEYLKQCDFGVQPSTIAEVQGISNLEYMKHGKPIITTNNGAQPEYVVNKENGILVRPNNPELLAEAIDLLCRDRELRIKLGAQAKHDFDTKLNYDTFYSKITQLKIE